MVKLMFWASTDPNPRRFHETHPSAIGDYEDLIAARRDGARRCLKVKVRAQSLFMPNPRAQRVVVEAEMMDRETLGHHIRSFNAPSRFTTHIPSAEPETVRI